MTEKTIEQLHIEHLTGLYGGYRMMKGRDQNDRMKVISDDARSICQHYAKDGLKAFLDRFEDATDEQASEWLWRRCDGIRLPDGSVWVS